MNSLIHKSLNQIIESCEKHYIKSLELLVQLQVLISMKKVRCIFFMNLIKIKLVNLNMLTINLSFSDWPVIQIYLPLVKEDIEKLIILD